MPAIATLTMNPALDVATETDAVRPTDKLRCSAPRHDPGGGGINVARVVHTLGGEAVAVFPSGGPAGQAIEALLAAEGVAFEAVPIAGQSRESFAVTERGSGLQYRFVMPGPALGEAERQACLDRIGEMAPAPAFVVASGSLPPGMGPEFFARLARLCAGIGARLILDSASVTPEAVAGQGVYLLKPNLRELEALAGRALPEADDQAEAARELIARGCAEVVVVSRGSEGAMLVTAGEAVPFDPIEVPLASAVGAGDSMVAAIVLGLVRGFPLREAVRFGMAAGAAALMTPGTELARRADVERLFGG